ncbi:MAG: PASTA domain-containing protein [Deltaproteobacteria bacterium]|nr:PASTA domain-containing protein [Deltaproteobacteria bacterium]MBW1919943.1 PASTA domain-containing protein [Deltaproteobacteria bacterium]MBW1934140.1 PASTA domain-containing protein [Deltaproteobacteria bacterium]MBW1977141.1 PASTA domain-containing protein [Deltaproteobacteria bacterium]MBW2043587.1 PASTA domain-containing protein [Deltaproteobacteria bacterium]
MKVREKKWIRFRIYVVTFFFVGGLGIILSRAYQLQVLERERLTSIALAGYRDVIRLPSKRGTIYDREGHELAVSISVDSIYARPALIKEKLLASRKLARTLQVKQSKIFRVLNSKRPFVWLVRREEPDKVKQVKSLHLEGVGFTKESRRYYPGKEIAAHVLGFAGTDHKGLEGLEKAYDKILRGPECRLVQMRDALGRPFYVSRVVSDGRETHDLVLTIDKDVQYRAQQALNAAVAKTKSKSGQCVIVNAVSGEVLAMAVSPSFNPNVFWKYHSYQWRNRTITDCYEPGSVIKAFLLGAALDSGTISPDMKFYCEKGEYRVGRRIIHDHHAGGYDFLSVREIIAFSSNIGAVKIGEKLGYERFYEYLRKFGFGRKTGIDLIGERSGFVRPVESAKEIEKATICFGQGMTATSLQLVMAMAAIANRGRLMRPYLVREIRDEEGKVIRKTPPRLVRRVISAETASKVAEILEHVVSKEGTGSLAAIEGYRVAGKTGTSQKVDPRTRSYSNQKYVSLFVGFVPVDRPKLVILVMLNEPQGNRYGGVVAAPVFREVGAWSLNHLGVHPQLVLVKNKEEKQKFPSRPDRSLESKVREINPDFLPDFTGQTMRDVLREARSLGLEVVLEGTGLAVSQSPKAGHPLGKISKVKVSFHPPI